MAQYVEAYGQTIEFPDGMSPDEIGAAIKKSALSIPRVKAANPTDDMGTGERLAAGAGKAVVDLGRGIGQYIPTIRDGKLSTLVTRDDVAESRKLDKALVDTTAGTIGNIGGNAAMLLGTARLPFANTMTGAATIGAVTGATAPSTSTSETLMNTGVGAVAAPLAIGLVRGGQALYQGAKGLIEPLTKSGQERIAADVLRRSATDPLKAAQTAAQARQLVPGSPSTLAQVAEDPGLAQLQRTVLNNQEYAPALQSRFAMQKDARLNAIKDIAGRGDHYDEIAAGRALFANEDYAAAKAAGVDQKMAKALQPQIESLMERPSIQAAQADAIRLAKESGKNIDNFGSVEGMDWLKKALDNKISQATGANSSIGKADLAALVQTKSDLMKTLEQIAPAYKSANDNFRAMSGQVNSMDVARDLMGKLQKPGSEYMQNGGREMGAAYSGALSKSFDTVKKSTGMSGNIEQMMPPRDIGALENVARDIGRKTFAEEAGKATGSDTAQNLISQNFLRRTLGPTGLPETWAESSMLQGLLSPVQFAGKLSGADRKIMDRIAQGLLDPMDGIGLLSKPAQIQAVGLLGAPNVQRYLPAVGLLGASSAK